MPANVVRKSAIGQPFMYPFRRCDAFRGRVHDLRTAIGAVATYEHSWIVLGPSQLPALALADRDDHHVTRDRFSRAQFQARDGAVSNDAPGRRIEPEPTPIALRELVFVVIARHVGLA